MQVNLKQYRSEKGMTREELARRVGISGSYISRLEHGDREPGVLLALKIAAVLDVGVGQVWKLDPVPVVTVQPSQAVAYA